MLEYCTCGAQLPPDARFCHRCGKPQGEEIVSEPAVEPALNPIAAAPPEIAAPPAAPPRVSFHNTTAVRIGLLMAGAASLFSALPAMAGGLLGLALWWICAGFLSVYFYRRRTGYRLTFDNGLRMGGITGLLGATITAVVFTAIMVPMIRGGSLARLYADQFHRMYGSDLTAQQMKILEDPNTLGIAIVFGWLFSFLIITFLATAGGALGAKMFGRVTGPRS
jgi:hypothetical protein